MYTVCPIYTVYIRTHESVHPTPERLIHNLKIDNHRNFSPVLFERLVQGLQTPAKIISRSSPKSQRFIYERSMSENYNLSDARPTPTFLACSIYAVRAEYFLSW